MSEPKSTVNVERGGSGTYAYVRNPEGRLIDVWAMHIEPMPEHWPDEWKQAANDGLAALGRACDECGKPVPPPVEWQQVVEGGTGIARGHRSCIEAEWGPLAGRDRMKYGADTDA